MKENLIFALLDEIGEALKSKEITLDEMIERGRDIRAQLLKEQYGIDSSDDGINLR